ncbi:helix-turn-helix domain-containing protein [Pelagovum pacificum]|nr:helix-turn-helix domain-containing protein [Pelagovum pacificum]QQA41292.1 AraC family transcriptional regulator [Pelagovum pacificum]
MLDDIPQTSRSTFDTSSAPPGLFARTEDFRFFARTGHLTHRTLDFGPSRLRIVAVNSTGHEARFFEDSRTAITLPVSGHSEVEADGHTFRTIAGDAFIIGPSERRSRLMPGKRCRTYQSYTIIGPSNAAYDWPNRSVSALIRGNGCTRQMSHLLCFLMELVDQPGPLHGRQTALAAALLSDLWDMLITAAFSEPPHGSCASGPGRIVSEAHDIMRANLSEPMTIQSIADLAGVTPRTLQRAFLQRLGETPRAHLSKLRLATMNATLKAGNPGTTVTSAALDAGLVHLGRCSALYREQFGELPSETLCRSRRDLG